MAKGLKKTLEELAKLKRGTTAALQLDAFEVRVFHNGQGWLLHERWVVYTRHHKTRQRKRAVGATFEEAWAIACLQNDG